MTEVPSARGLRPFRDTEQEWDLRPYLCAVVWGAMDLMKLLVLESEQDLARDVTIALARAGHQIATCTDRDSDSPCRSIDEPFACPLDHPTDLAIVVRPAGSGDSLREMGAVCAERHRVPVVHVEPASGDLERTIRAAAAAGKDRNEAACAAAVRNALADERPRVEVGREHDRTWVNIALPADHADAVVWAITGRAREAVRRYDPFVKAIDISVTFDR